MLYPKIVAFGNSYPKQIKEKVQAMESTCGLKRTQEWFR